MESSTRLNTASIAGYVLLVAGIVALLYNGGILATSPAGWTLQLMAVLLMVWARITFGSRSFHLAASPTAGGIVTRGPYAYVRHPIYGAVLLFTWTGIISNISQLNILFGVVATAGAAVRIISEERMLVARYPEYREYAARVKRIVPFVF